MNIALDMMGGDFAPEETIKGVKLFLSQNSDSSVNLTLIGDIDQMSPHFEPGHADSHRIHLVHASEVIEMHEHPTKALKEKPQSSIAIGFHLLAAGKTDAFISAGNTGAMLVGSLYSIKAINGVARPAIGAYMPRDNGKTSLLVDVGLNSDCKPENLLQFALLGSLFAKYILNFDNPRVALINVGSEEGKGNILCQTAFPLLKENKQINFIGNIEGRDLLMSKAEVYVCDGFTGNIILKFAESIYDIVQNRKIKDEYFNRFNFEMYGGVPVLGVNKPVIIGHGISTAGAFDNMILMAKKMIDEEFIEKIKSNFL
ncbi:phosphate acyltransferase PlsX [Hanamia caeni]|jgi:glycerol-3-phosphate acyltransferase PlsX|uniref:Phosphate acyltransferase n=1 Tax=Hanamia caeni TaxID=2294116 RepID=A0A3M9NBZ1_9BACT|nr:phosphate acyltransferase PlsX [Hanamia caeni]RNI35276.1 phosphate acyltransferase PlsX [Hanamia caeni]